MSPTGATTDAYALVPVAEVVASTLPPHHLARDEDGRATATCGAPEGSRCRMVCAESCEAEWWPCGPEDQRHPMRDGGECQVLLFLNADDPDELFVVGGDPEAHTYAGPITVSWDLDTYLWEPVGSGDRVAPGGAS